MMNLDLVEVEWVDACEMEAGWHEISEIKKHTVCTCRDVGWILPTPRNDQLLLIGSFAPKMSDDSDDVDMGGRATAIPQSWIVKIRKLIYDTT